jgi:hypothetical protein
VCQPTARAALQCDFDTARAALDDATVDTATRATSWRWWQQYCTDCGTDPWLRDTTPAIRSQLLLGFAARTRTGFFGKGWQVGAQTVEKALRHVAQAFVLEGYPDPRRAGAGPDLALPFTHLLKSFRVRDSAPQPQVALPVHAIDRAAAARNDPNASRLAPRGRNGTPYSHGILLSFASRRVYAPTGAPLDPHCAVSYLRHSFLAGPNFAPAHQGIGV